MSKLNKLISELCPHGVEYKKTFEIKLESFWLMPSTPNYIENGIPYITSKNVKNGNVSFEDVSYISEDDYKQLSKNRKIEKNDLLITMIGTIGEMGFVKDNTQFYGQNLYLLRLNPAIINRKYYYYCFQSKKNEIISRKNPSSQGYIKAGSIEELKIPVPPLEIQNEIVRQLDYYLELSSYLTLELLDRTSQYKYYANILFDDAKNSDYKYIKDVCSVIKGKSPIQKTKPGCFPMVVTTEQRKTSDEYQFDSKSVCVPLISSRGHGIASLNHVYYQEGKFALGNILAAITPNNENQLLAKYLYYYLELTKDTTLVPLMKGGANVAMHLSDILTVKIPIPSVSSQKRIIYILGLFDEYCTNLNNEINLRNTQYCYYRDKILSFKEMK